MDNPKKTPQWNHAKDEMLIELVKGKPELYDLTSLYYSDNMAKRRSWVEISRQLGCEERTGICKECIPPTCSITCFVAVLHFIICKCSTHTTISSSNTVSGAHPRGAITSAACMHFTVA
ncbi:uncharacterized protein LOC143032523 [Oratosquilla oratoria]|uniref:uncharacterized protein LOC143032523 n=1 Tax=Oratosquilla oratoria TaxID=337810 RepID=UPI003F76C320